ncbi:MAG: ABC transporter ATP-binding protein [Chloroflexota bacterium]
MIEARGLTKRFDDFTAVDNVSLTVGPGTLLALLGPNGAGKTTSVRMLSAILKPTMGSASINGYDVATEAEQVRRHIGLLTEQPGLYTRSTGLEYVTFYGRLYGMRDDDIQRRALALFERFNMPNTAQRRLGEYSKGMRQKVGIIRAMLHDPAVLLLDEPTSAMDPHSAKLVRDAVLELRDERRAIIVCTHNLAEAELLADRIAIISQGKIIAENDPDALKQQLQRRQRFELRLDRSPNGLTPDSLDDLVTVESIHEDTIRYLTDDPLTNNPQLVRRLDGLGLGLVELRELSASLEDVYLNIVAGEDR